jgi:hypothetical protein
MTTVVNRSTWLTGAAGLLLVVTAVVMMVCSAPRIHEVRQGPLVSGRLASWAWVTRGHSAPGPAARTPNGVRP